MPKFIKSIFLLAFILIGSSSVYSQKVKPKDLIGKNFQKYRSPRCQEKLDFINDSVVVHSIYCSDNDSLRSETLKYDIKENVVIIREFKIKDGWMKHGKILVMKLDADKIEKDFYGREFADDCMIEQTDKKGKRIYLDDFSGRPGLE